MSKLWVEKPRSEKDLLKQLLVNKGLVDSCQQAAFLAPKYDDLFSPRLLLNAKELVDRLIKAINAKERIAIFGDYDHDGTPAAALLYDVITRVGGKVARVYIPSRDEGYSITHTIVDYLASEKINLLILVDCGITNKPEIDRAVDSGIDCLVIDHHVVQADKYPEKAIVVNPKQSGDTYPFKELCACALVFKIAQLLGEVTGKITAGQMKWYLDLVAISTICDMVPLENENRIFVTFGLQVLRKTRRLGLKMLMEVAAIDPSSVNAYTVGFGIGPRLNAPGRIEKASIAYDLLVATDLKETRDLANHLNDLNRRRQEELTRVLVEAESAVLQQRLQERKVIMVAGDGWPEGIVGLVAGRLTDKYHRPAFVLSTTEDGLIKGSGRSIDNFHLVDALQLCQAHLVKFGGHAKAAGLTLEKEEFTQLYDKLLIAADGQLDEHALRPKLTIDARLTEDELTLSTVASLAKLEPYGLGNSRPLLMLASMEVQSCKAMGADKRHLKLELALGEGTVLEAVAFGFSERGAQCQVGTRLDLVGSLEVNEWRGTRKLQLKIIDWRSAC